MKKEEDHWTTKTIVEPNTGKYYRDYFFKKQLAHRIIIGTPKATVLAGYTLIEKDLRSAIIWLNYIKDQLKDEPSFIDPIGSVETPNKDCFTIMKGLFVAALTFYGKSFTTCEGRKVKLERANLDEKFYEEHDNAMEYRHNYAAHSGAKKLEQAVVVLALDKKRKSNPYFGRELYQPDLISLNDLNGFGSLFEHAKDFADRKIEILSDKVYDEDVLPKGADYWYSKT
ncbi:MAG: hypothetical protein KAV87_64790 [Desulfobacteraceae bacterium]|nr:hypothetical protein [Desulfobacteraceae bacterium]